jgi:hypothetical protein
VTSLREIKLLREINSPYVVNMLDIFVHKKRLAMVGGGLLQAIVMSASHSIQATCGNESTCTISSLCKTTNLPISHRLFC